MKNLEEINFGLIIKDLVTKKKLSVDTDLVPFMQKSRTAVFDDFKKSDMSIKTVLKYFQILDKNICEVLSNKTYSNNETFTTAQEPESEYQKMQPIKEEIKDQKIKYLEKLLEEKERLIRVLMDK